MFSPENVVNLVIQMSWIKMLQNQLQKENEVDNRVKKLESKAKEERSKKRNRVHLTIARLNTSKLFQLQVQLNGNLKIERTNLIIIVLG